MLYTTYSNAFEILEAHFCANIRAQKAAGTLGLFDPVRVVSGSAAINQRLRLSLARQAGICAGVDFWTTQSWLHNYSGIGLGSAASNQEFVWIIWAALDDAFINEHPRLAHYFEKKSGAEYARARYELSCKIAAVFDKYVNYRFDWVADWLNLQTAKMPEEGFERAQVERENALLTSHLDYAWQKALWKRLGDEAFRNRFAWKGYETLKLYASDASRKKKIENEPSTLHFFAPFGISPLMLGVIKDLAEHKSDKGPQNVYTYILNPCREYWFESYGKDDESEGKILDYLRKNSAASRAMINRFYAFADEGETAEPKNVRTIESVHALSSLQNQRHLSTAAKIERMDLVQERSLLHAAQKAIVENDIDALPDSVAAALDRSVRLIKAPTLTREVQNAVQLLHGLFSDETMSLSPDDVLIVTPDIEKTAPVMQSVLLALPAEYRIDFQVKGLSAATDDMTAKALIELGKMLMNAPDLKMLESWLELPLVAKRFDLSLDELSVLHDWLVSAGFRRGITAQQLGPQSDNAKTTAPDAQAEATLERALERLSWGFVMPQDRASVTGDVLAIQHGSNTKYETVVKRQALFEKLLKIFDALKCTLDQTPSPDQVLAPALASAWAHDLVERFFQKSSDVRALMAFEAALRELDMSLAPQNDALDDSISMPLAVYWRALEDHFRVPSDKTPAVGRVTLAPMGYARTLPYKVIIALGLNEESPFPGKQHFDEFDLMGAAGLKRQNDRDSRADNRNVFLDLITSCRERLFLSYSVGMDAKNPKNPSPVVDDFMQFLTANVPFDQQAAMREALTVHVPLTDTSPENFTSDAKRYWGSFDAALLEAVNEAVREGYWLPEPVSITGSLNEALFSDVISIDELADFVKNPDDWIRKKLSLREFDNSTLDEIPIAGLNDNLNKAINRRRWLALLQEGLDQAAIERLIEYDPAHGAQGLRTLVTSDELKAVSKAYNLSKQMRAAGDPGQPITLSKTFDESHVFKTVTVKNLANTRFNKGDLACKNPDTDETLQYSVSSTHPYLIEFVTSKSSLNRAFICMMLANALVDDESNNQRLGLIAIESRAKDNTDAVSIYEPADGALSTTFVETILKMIDIAVKHSGLKRQDYDELIWRGREPDGNETGYTQFNEALIATQNALNARSDKSENLIEAWVEVNNRLDEEYACSEN